MVQRKVYLDNLSLEEATERLVAGLRERGATTGVETIPVAEALGRITAKPVFARLSNPHYHASAMDGYAVKATVTFGASETSPKRLKLREEAFLVDTGDPLPDGCDAVIMIEDTQPIGEEDIEIIASVAPWQHVRPIGEDIVATEMIVPANHKLVAYDIGALLAGGLLEVEVRKLPVVAVLPTGTELVPPGTEVKAGDIIEFNSKVLGGLVSEWGGTPKYFPISKDDYQLIKSRVLEALEQADVVLINAGSSAGSEDFTAHIVAEIGELVCHGVAIKPGKPVIIGFVGDKPVIGVPGYPVSAAITTELFVKPILKYLTGGQVPLRPKITASVSRKLVSPLGQEEFVRIKLGMVGDKMIATPMSRGAGVITSLVRADGMLRVPRLSEGYQAGEQVEVEIYRELEAIKNTTVVVGSHDITLDLLSNTLHIQNGLRSLSSAHVGSLGGIMAIRRGEAHMAGIHLLDEATGEYNIGYINRYLPNQPVYLVNLAYREQGLIVAQGNPKGISGLSDLVDKQLRYINRQRGAGTRILLDYELGKLGINPEAVQGYEREEMTHMAVAAAVANGSADTGLGIKAAAAALELDFVPVTMERYDLLIDARFWDTDWIADIMELLHTPEFKATVAGLGGYDTKDMGKVMYKTQ